MLIEINNSCKKIRGTILKTCYNAQAGHMPSALCIVEILSSLHLKIMEEDDIFILSKGHGCLALYSVLYELGHLTDDDMLSFSKYNSALGGHPDRNKIEKIFASTGSLGHGLPIAAGVALSKKIKKEKGNTYCLVGDGECNEGTIWETAMLAAHNNLDNLFCIVDDNNSQIRSLPSKNIKNKFEAFGWDVIEVDGHNVEKIISSIELLDDKNQKPKCLICNTVKGKGVKDMENDMFAWHHGPPNKDQYKRFMEEINNA